MNGYEIFCMEMDTQINFAGSENENGGEEGFVGILNVENEMLQAALRRTKALIITRNRNKLQTLRESTVKDVNIHLLQ
jgi:hypothetical protein